MYRFDPYPTGAHVEFRRPNDWFLSMHHARVLNISLCATTSLYNMQIGVWHVLVQSSRKERLDVESQYFYFSGQNWQNYFNEGELWTNKTGFREEMCFKKMHLKCVFCYYKKPESQVMYQHISILNDSRPRNPKKLTPAPANTSSLYIRWLNFHSSPADCFHCTVNINNQPGSRPETPPTSEILNSV